MKELKHTMDEGQAHFTILDVGAGPLTNVGFVMPEPPGTTFEVIPVDHQAKLYDYIMPECRVSPVKRTRQMLAVVKPGHIVYAGVTTNLAEKEQYVGPRQWN